MISEHLFIRDISYQFLKIEGHNKKSKNIIFNYNTHMLWDALHILIQKIYKIKKTNFFGKLQCNNYYPKKTT